MRFVVLALLAVSACATYSPTQIDFEARDAAINPAASPDLPDILKRGLTEAVDFYDPYSVVVEPFVAVRAVDTTSTRMGAGWFVCGTFNAKNRLGGYVGAQPFRALMAPDGRSVRKISVTFERVNCSPMIKRSTELRIIDAANDRQP